MNIGVVGSRNLEDYEVVERVLQSSVHPTEDTIISGGAKGADQLAEHFANDNNIPKKIYKPDYDQYGKAAPFIRNQLIVDDADMIVAFWDGKSKGTLDTIKKAEKKGITVMNIIVKTEERKAPTRKVTGL